MTHCNDYIGIDVSKAHLDTSLNDGKVASFANDEAGIAALVERLQAQSPKLIVLTPHPSPGGRGALAAELRRGSGDKKTRRAQRSLRRATYLPMQKLEKIAPRRSSLPCRPVSSSSAPCARRSASAASSTMPP